MAILILCWCASVVISLLLVRVIYGPGRGAGQFTQARIDDGAVGVPVPPLTEPASVPVAQRQPALSGP